MSTEMMVILGGASVVALAILILRLGKRLAIGLLILGSLVVVGTVTLSMLAQASANRETAIAAQQAARAAQTASAGQAVTSAATSITLFLVILLLTVVLAAAGVALGWTWWQKQRKQEQYREMLQQAQIYAALQGRRPLALSRRPACPTMVPMPGYPTQAAPPSVVVVGQQPPVSYPYPYPYPPHYAPAVTGQDERELDAARLYLPDDTWEVLD
jgi:flagellar basal body-associated protein FliL